MRRCWVSFAGPLIASSYFFKGKNTDSLDTIQWVYLAVFGLGVVLNMLFLWVQLFFLFYFSKSWSVTDRR